jgi:hypothetical protein
MATDGNAITTSSTGRKSAIKDPNSTLDYSWDWRDWLAQVGDSIVTATFIVTDPEGATTPLVVASSVHFDGMVTAFVSGGTVGKTHKLTCRITTNSTPTPRTDDRSLYIIIRER